VFDGLGGVEGGVAEGVVGLAEVVDVVGDVAGEGAVRGSQVAADVEGQQVDRAGEEVRAGVCGEDVEGGGWVVGCGDEVVELVGPGGGVASGSVQNGFVEDGAVADRPGCGVDRRRPGTARSQRRRESGAAAVAASSFLGKHVRTDDRGLLGVGDAPARKELRREDGMGQRSRAQLLTRRRHLRVPTSGREELSRDPHGSPEEEFGHRFSSYGSGCSR
jgi:hypothetical protein